jgi:hypothetical protein
VKLANEDAAKLYIFSPDRQAWTEVPGVVDVSLKLAVDPATSWTGRTGPLAAVRAKSASGVVSWRWHTPDEDAMSMSDEDRRRIGPGFQADMSGFGYELDEDE